MPTPLLLAAVLPLAAQTQNRPDPARLSVEAQFVRYDADGDGMLDKAEFGSWAAALRAAKEADFQAEAPESTGWIDGSFAAMDIDRDGKVDRREFTRFLTPNTG